MTETGTANTDRGSILPMAMLITLLFSLVVVGIANYTAASLRFTSVVKDGNAERSALEGAARVLLEEMAYGTSECLNAATPALTLTLNDQTVTATCTKRPSLPGEIRHPAAVVTEADGLVIAEDDVWILGDLYLPVPPKEVGKRLIVDDGDVWRGSADCAAATPPPINRLIFEDPTERGYLCAPQNWRALFPPPSIPAPPAVAPEPVMINDDKCRVFFPGTYSNVLPSFEKQPDTYFVSGLYHFANVGLIKIKEGAVIAGRPGASVVADEGEGIWAPDCADAATDPAVNDTGTGVTMVLSGNSRFRVENKGRFEIHRPPNGYSLVGFDVGTNGYPVITRTSDPMVNQDYSDSALRVHGRIWAPTSVVRTGPPTRWEYTLDAEEAIGGQLLSGVVVARLEIRKRPPEGGYNMQVDTMPPQYQALVEVHGHSSTLRTIVEVRPDWNQLAVMSWRIETREAS